MGGTILRDTDRYTLKGNGQINKQETGFLQKPRKYHRLTFLQILKSILIKRNLLTESFRPMIDLFSYVTQKFSPFVKGILYKKGRLQVGNYIFFWPQTLKFTKSE